MGESQGQKETERLGGFCLEKLDRCLDIGIIAMIRQFTTTRLIEKAIVARIVKGVGIRAEHSLAMRARRCHTVGKTGRRQEIILAVHQHRIAGLLEVFEQVWFMGPQEMPQGAMAAYMGIEAGHHTTARRRADRMLDVALVKACALASQGVNIGRWHQWVTITADALGTQLIRLKDDKVHDDSLVWCLGVWLIEVVYKVLFKLPMRW